MIEEQLQSTLQVDYRLTQIQCRAPSPGLLALLGLGVIERAVLQQALARDSHDGLSVVLDPVDPVVGDVTDRRGAELPLGTHGLDLPDQAGLGHHQHPFLGL
jgi:hypothetical protein